MTPIPLRCFGRALWAGPAVIGRVALEAVAGDEQQDSILVGDYPTTEGYAGIISTRDLNIGRGPTPVIHRVRSVAHLETGDVVRMDDRGNVRTLYRVQSLHNAMLTTERCNSNCLMCSQPPKEADDSYLIEQNLSVIRLIDPRTEVICFTGGEPTLLGEGFLRLLRACRDHLPTTHVHVLSNGRTFADGRNAARVAEIGHPSLTFGIPLYAPIPEVHDYIVQARGAFAETSVGLHWLARHRIQVEIRVVLHRETIPHLIDHVEHIYRNFTFAQHVALMGLEPMGYVKRNWDLLWVDPMDYAETLEQAIRYLHTAQMNASIYNLPLCVLPRSLWRFARQSISDWKNIYLPECESCSEKPRCSGLFASAKDRHSRAIAAIAREASADA